MNLSIICVLAFLVVYSVSGEKKEVTFWKVYNLQDESKTLTYEGNECINLPPDWQKKTKSADIHGHCIRAYMQLDCNGSPAYLHRGNPDYRFLSVFNLENKIVSFKKCESNVYLKLDARPRYTMSVHDGTHKSRNSYEIDVTSGECHTLPVEWHNRVSAVVIPNGPCFVFYDETTCTGNKRYINFVREIGTGHIIKSVKTAEITFHDGCNPVTCPKYLHEKSNEYAFWNYFFSIYSLRYRNQFEARVKKSNDGFISWDFLLAPNTSALSIGDQYTDAFGILHRILSTLIEGQPGKLGFKMENVKKLSAFVKTIRTERQKDLERFTEDWKSHNYAIVREMEWQWFVTDQLLTTLDGIWNSETKILYGEKKQVTFWKGFNRQDASIILPYEGSECINLPPDWQKKTSSADIHGHCIRVYLQLDCNGPPAYLHRGNTDYNFLSVFTLENKIVSFKKCEPNLRFKLDARPRHTMSVHNGAHTTRTTYEVNVASGECHTLPQDWYNPIFYIVIPNFGCWIFYDQIECTGNKKYKDNVQVIGYGNVIKSVKTCELKFQDECKPVTCPKYLYRGSAEYAFWRYYFSIYSTRYRNQFEERVKKSNDGFISWDFLFASNTSATSIGDQYSDAFQNLHLVMSNLMEGQPGTLGFNTNSINTLSDLALNIHNERAQQSGIFSRNWTDHNSAIVMHMAYMWSTVVSHLDTVSRYWNRGMIGDICGLIEPRQNLLQTSTLISEGDKAFYGEDPWHAAIYSGVSKTLICGATIISPNLLVSAAHCFFSEGLEKALNDTSEYEIYVAKFTRTYSTRDGNGQYQKIHKIKELVFSPAGYNPILTQSYGSDIILIILEKPVEYNKFVRPACIDWDGSVFRDLHDGQMGRVVGWGVTTNGGIPDPRDASEYLMVAQLPYLSYGNCVGKVNHITNDKFCGGALTGPSVQSGDSGGGFMFKSGERYYLRGIVSTRDAHVDSSVSTFTNIEFYTSWIKNYI